MEIVQSFTDIKENMNTLEVHDRYRMDRDGRDTSRKIAKILNRDRCPNARLEHEFLRYCQSLGVIPVKKNENIGNSKKCCRSDFLYFDCYLV